MRVRHGPDILGAGGMYRGAFQFSEGTWKSAPQSPGGDPIAYSYRTQAFVAVRLRTRDGDGHWPNCASVRTRSGGSGRRPP